MDKFKWELLIACFLLGACTASFVLFLFCDINVHRKNNWAAMLNRILMWIPRLWYPLILILSTVYVCCNFSDCLNFQFFSDFQGDNLIFIVCLLLWILPLFDKFEIFGANFKLRWQNEVSQKAADEAIRMQGANGAEQLENMINEQEGKGHVE